MSILINEAPRRKCRWTKEEDKILLNHRCRTDVYTLAKSLGRTVQGVRSRMQTLDCRNFDVHYNSVSPKYIGESFNISDDKVHGWINKHGLKCKKRKLKSSTYTHVKIDILWDWLDKNREKVDFSRYERMSLIPEPNWLDEQINIDRKIKNKRGYKRWTPTDDYNLLKMFYIDCIKQEDIGKYMGVSVDAVRKRKWKLSKNGYVKKFCESNKNKIHKMRMRDLRKYEE